MRLSKYIALFILCISSASCAQKNPGCLVPQTPSQAPDYYCTWNIQGYVCSYSFGAGSNDLRSEMNEDNIFGGSHVYPGTSYTYLDNSGNPQTVPVQPLYKGWLKHYPMLHADLHFVMDDSWDIPKDSNSKRPYGSNYDNENLALVRLDETRFPSFIGDDITRLRQITDSVKSFGWRGLGGWICAQNPICLTREYTGKENTMSDSKQWSESQEEAYWKKKLRESQEAGFLYWKVDWGNKDRNDEFRINMSRWAREVAPDVIIEHASFQDGGIHKPYYINFAQTLRTYDVNNNIAQAQTISRVLEVLSKGVAEREGWGIINCEDEPYIAAGLGCAIGVMRHPFVGNLPNGKTDSYFEAGTRRVKNRLNEIVRAVRWHRIAEPFGADGDYTVSSDEISESGAGKQASAPALASRRIALPQFSISSEAQSDLRPYLLASAYDNGCTAISSINRNVEGQFQQQRPSVIAEAVRWDRKVGLFGYFGSITLNYQSGLPKGRFKVFAQDLASDEAPVSIPFKKGSDGKSITISGKILEKLCKGHDYPYSEVEHEPGKDYTDLSDPAVVLLVVE